MRFRLRTILIVVAGLAVLFAQYPFLDFRVTGGSASLELTPDGEFIRIRHTEDRGYYVPRVGPTLTLCGECAALLVWWIVARRKKRSQLRATHY